MIAAAIKASLELRPLQPPPVGQEQEQGQAPRTAELSGPTWRMQNWLKEAGSRVTDSMIELTRRQFRRMAHLSDFRINVSDASDFSIAYLDSNKSHPTPVLMLHGFCGDKDLWVRFAGHLSHLAYRLIIPDLPGFGDSSRCFTELYDCKTQAQRMFAFMTALKIDKFHVVGSSMGGNIAGRMAIDHPERILSLTLIDALGVGSPKVSPVGLEILAGRNPLILALPEQFEPMIKWTFVKPPPMPGFIMRHLADKIIQHHDFNRKIFLDLANFNDELTSELHTIRAPTLVLWGDTDLIIDVSAAAVFQSKIPNCQTQILSECGHLPMTEQPQAAALILANFLANARPH